MKEKNCEVLLEYSKNLFKESIISYNDLNSKLSFELFIVISHLSYVSLFQSILLKNEITLINEKNKKPKSKTLLTMISDYISFLENQNLDTSILNIINKSCSFFKEIRNIIEHNYLNVDDSFYTSNLGIILKSEYYNNVVAYLNNYFYLLEKVFNDKNFKNLIPLPIVNAKIKIDFDKEQQKKFKILIKDLNFFIDKLDKDINNSNYFSFNLNENKSNLLIHDPSYSSGEYKSQELLEYILNNPNMIKQKNEYKKYISYKIYAILGLDKKGIEFNQKYCRWNDTYEKLSYKKNLIPIVAYVLKNYEKSKINEMHKKKESININDIEKKTFEDEFYKNLTLEITNNKKLAKKN